MDLTTVLVLYFGIFLLLFWLSYKCLRLTAFAALVVALMVSWLALIIMQPLTGELTAYALMDGDPRACLYVMIWFITWVVGFAYLMIKALTDSRDKVCTRIPKT